MKNIIVMFLVLFSFSLNATPIVVDVNEVKVVCIDNNVTSIDLEVSTNISVDVVDNIKVEKSTNDNDIKVKDKLSGIMPDNSYTLSSISYTTLHIFNYTTTFKDLDLSYLPPSYNKYREQNWS